MEFGTQWALATLVCPFARKKIHTCYRYKDKCAERKVLTFVINCGAFVMKGTSLFIEPENIYINLNNKAILNVAIHKIARLQACNNLKSFKTFNLPSTNLLSADEDVNLPLIFIQIKKSTDSLEPKIHLGTIMIQLVQNIFKRLQNLIAENIVSIIFHSIFGKDFWVHFLQGTYNESQTMHLETNNPWSTKDCSLFFVKITKATLQ